MERTLRFAATLTPDTEVGGYVAEAVGVGVVSQGETVEEAVTNLREALELYFEDEPAEEEPVNNSAAPVLLTSVDVRLSA
ncbi:type II toxin-antitoxin system HicB family antitoxin [Nocardiopsis algeriensis]|uniref:type II toxin-antitoxin system HicB family antitoxin n=1 Tax=Nocardiopsis algeriensis TaxID=1478215 RepID=UPI003B436492